MQRRTPEEHRRAVDDWRANAPKDDRDIFHEISKKSKKPRHGSLAEQLTPLLMWMRRPEGLLPGEEKPQAPTVNTNWSVVPDNDNTPPKGYRVEASIEITPSIEEMARAVSGVEVGFRREPQMLKGGRHEAKRDKREVHAYPIGGGVEISNGIITRLGELRFSDGTSTEKIWKRSGDKLVRADAVLRAGTLLGCREKAAAKLGASEDPVEVRASNEYFAGLLGVELTTYRPASKKARKKLEKPTAASFTKCKPGLPRGSVRVADSFLGMKKTGCACNGAQAWEDICTSIVNREMWAETIAALPKKDIEVLERAMRAESFQEIGEFSGQSSEYARRKGGRRILLAVNDNLSEALKNSAA